MAPWKHTEPSKIVLKEGRGSLKRKLFESIDFTSKYCEKEGGKSAGKRCGI